MKKEIFKGLATALVTPFSGDKVDFKALDRLISFQLEGGADALVLLGTTGESSTLSLEEKQSIVDFSVKKISGRAKIIVGSGSNDTKKAIEQSRLFEKMGADALLVITPYYNKCNKEGLKRHFFSVADGVSCPIMVYNVPSRTGMNIGVDGYEMLSSHENICAVKEADNDFSKLSFLAARLQGRLDFYSGNDDTLLPFLSLGAKGIVSAYSNLAPKRVKAVLNAFFAGDIALARREQFLNMGAIRALFSSVNPICIKAGLSLMGLCENELRLPLASLDENEMQALKKELISSETEGLI